MNDALQILKQNKVSVTKNRLRLLQLFLSDRTILDYQELMQLSQHELERTSIFRNLNLFVKKNILRRVPGIDGRCRYTLEHGNSAVKTPQKTAAVICSKCHDVKIVPLALEPKIVAALASGFIMQQVVLEGLCKNCK